MRSAKPPRFVDIADGGDSILCIAFVDGLQSFACAAGNSSDHGMDPAGTESTFGPASPRNASLQRKGTTPAEPPKELTRKPTENGTLTPCTHHHTNHFPIPRGESRKPPVGGWNGGNGECPGGMVL